MNAQFLATIRSSLIFIGGMAVGRGLVDQDTMLAIVSAAMTMIPVAWSWYTHSQAGVIAAASALTAVQAVVTTPEVANSDKFRDDEKVITVQQAVSNIPPARL